MHALAKNCFMQPVLNNGVIAMLGAKDVCLFFNGCSAFKLQGSSDGGSTYNDILGSAITPASDSNVAANSYGVSITECRFDHLKVVVTTTGDFQCFAVHTGLRDVVRGVGTTTFQQPGVPSANAGSYPVVSYANPNLLQMSDPVLGAYNATTQYI